MAEDASDDDDDEDDEDFYFDRTGDDDEEQETRNENRILGGLRWLFNRVNDEDTQVYDDEDQDSDDEEDDDDGEPKPSVGLITSSLIEQGITMEDMVKVMLLSHEEYAHMTEQFDRIDDTLFGKIRRLISNYQPEQEQEPPQVQAKPEPSCPLVADISSYYSSRFNTVI
jgi:hypothetical protein